MIIITSFSFTGHLTWIKKLGSAEKNHYKTNRAFYFWSAVNYATEHILPTLFPTHHSLIPHKAKTDAAVPVGRSVAEPIRGTQVLSASVPASATQNAVRPRRCASRVCPFSATITPIPVATPFPHIPAHVVQSQTIGLLHTHILRTPSAILAVPPYFTSSITPGIRVVTGWPIASPCSIFPFCFSRQAVHVSISIPCYTSIMSL
jgi:hypothetical protein